MDFDSITALPVLGQGSFTTAYLSHDPNKVFLETVCPVKKALAEASPFSASYRVPQYTYLGTRVTGTYNEVGVTYLESELYDVYELEEHLLECLDDRNEELYGELCALGKGVNFVEDLLTVGYLHRSISPKFWRERDVLCAILCELQTVLDPQDIALDPRSVNFGVRQGKLVFLDLFYCRGTMTLDDLDDSYYSYYD